MSRTIQTVTKWLPKDQSDHSLIFHECEKLKKITGNLLIEIGTFLEKKPSKTRNFDEQDLEGISSTMESVVTSFEKIFQSLDFDSHSPVIAEKVKLCKDQLWKNKLKISYVLQELINKIAHLFIYHGKNILRVTLRICNSYNNLFTMDTRFSLPKTTSNICNNSSPYLFFPLRRISVTRLLQIISNHRAETCCHKLIDCLLETYKLEETDDDTGSDNSSVEIYKALTKHMSPPDSAISQKTQISNFDTTNQYLQSISELINQEEKTVLELLNTILEVSPTMLGQESTKKISRRAKEKVLVYYEQILWGQVGNFLEHIILWWTSSPLSARSPHSSQHLREWLNQFIPVADLPPVVLCALTSLSDALGVHVTLTSWDQHFRLALVAAKSPYNPETGKLFCGVLQELVMLSNLDEVTPDWMVGAPLDELPLVEQIPVLHRLDHSIHTTRLWAANETKKIAINWNVDAFFMITHSDVVSCLGYLNGLRFADHGSAVEKGGLGEHVQVCTLMRAKLVSEVKENINKLKLTPNQCVKNLASICRTISLANLQMIYPQNSYWRKVSPTMPEKPSPYVPTYLERILTPILLATDEHTICNMILQIMCEAWLDHIYMNKIKFSQFGACQLLCDFAFIETWLTNSTIMNQTIKTKMIKNEVLRRCEGVGRLLLRCPGEQIKMTDGKKHEQKNELMPAEMYVPNQEQWLELRALKKRKKLFVINSLCCGEF